MIQLTIFSESGEIERKRLVARSFQETQSFGESRLVTGRYGHPGAQPAEQDGCLPANAGRGAGHQHDAAG